MRAAPVSSGGLLIAIAVALSSCQRSSSANAGPPAPSREAAVQDVLFTRRAPGQNDLLVKRADGSIVHLTAESEGDNWGVWSPDGSAIAFQARRDGNTEVYVMDADGRNQRNLSNDPGQDGLPIWSPDGRSIAFFSSRGLVQTEDGLAGHIYVMGRDGEGVVQLSREPLAGPTGPTGWSKDGRHLFFTRLGPSGSRIMRYDVERGSEDLVYVSEAQIGGAVLSPEGGRLATYHDDGSSSRIAILDLRESPLRLAFLTGGGQHYYPRWSADGRHLIYTALATDGGSYDIERVDIATGTVDRVLSGPESDLEASWRPLR